MGVGKPRKHDKHLPLRMRRKGRRFYYRARDGSEIALGGDLAEARKKWAELENLGVADGALFRTIADKYELAVIPKKAPRTQADNRVELKNLRAVFDEMPMASIRPGHVRKYLDLRGEASPVRANREKALLSHIFNWARERDLLTCPNPCAGVKKHSERAREVFVDDAAYKAVWDLAAPAVRDAMDLARLTGQRPADVLRMARTDIRDGCLEVQQGKTGKRLRIEISGELAELVERIKARGAGLERKVSSVYLVQDENGQPVSYWVFVKRFAEARDAAGQKWQFRDLRAKTGTEKTDAEGARAAQRLLGHASVSTTETYIRNRRGDRVKPLK